VTERMIRATTLAGTRDEIVDSIRAVKKAGIRQVAIQPVVDNKTTLQSFSPRAVFANSAENNPRIAIRGDRVSYGSVIAISTNLRDYVPYWRRCKDWTA
jgi:hypothetical protein